MDTYSDLEVQQILQKALQRRSGERLSRTQVEEIAQELGLSSADLAAAEAEWRAEVMKDKERLEFIRLIRRRFRDSLVTYILINGGLLCFNFLINKAITWAIFPLLGWGVLLLLEGWSVIATDGHRFEQRLKAWHNQKEQERLNKEFKQKLAASAAEVTDKFASTTSKLFKKIEKWLDES